MFKSKQKVLGGILSHEDIAFLISLLFFLTQEAAQQELNEQKQQFEEKVTHLHEAMVLKAFIYKYLIAQTELQRDNLSP